LGGCSPTKDPHASPEEKSQETKRRRARPRNDYARTESVETKTKEVGTRSSHGRAKRREWWPRSPYNAVVVEGRWGNVFLRVRPERENEQKKGRSITNREPRSAIKEVRNIEPCRGERARIVRS